MTDTDESLLQAFASTRDEKAFRALADRYLGLVFHTAMRHTGHRQIAEEISQNILCALAKRASSLARNPDRLPAWLHRATLYESSKAMRAETSQQRRQFLQIPPASPPEDSAWSDAIPHLDAALNQLPDADRHVVLLHFFDKRSFPGIARSLGKSTVAIQKQSQRALEKLACLLRAKGVTLTGTVIATGLSAEFAKAAPLTLVQSATTAVLTGTATNSSTGLTLMFAAKSKVLIPLVLLFCALPLALQQVMTSNARSSQADARDTAARADRAPAPRTTKRNNRTTVLSVEEFCKRLAAAKTKGTEDAVRSSIKKETSNLSADQLVRLLAEVKTSSCAGRTGLALESTLADSLALNHPALAADYAVAAFSSQPTTWESFCGLGLFDGWAKQDVNSLIAWSDQHRGLFASDKSTIVIASETAILKILMKSESANAMARIHSLPADLALATVGRTFREQSRLLEPDQAIDFLRDALNRENHEDLVGETCGPQLYRGGRDKLRTFFRNHDATLKEREAIIYQAVNMEVNMGFTGTPREYVEQVRAFADEEGPGITGKLTALILGTIADRDHDDKAAVDMLLAYDPDPASLRVFLKARGASLDAEQSQRIAERLASQPDSP